jgi:hypothetical protein
MASDHSLAFAGAVLLLGHYVPSAVSDDVRSISEVHGGFRSPRPQRELGDVGRSAAGLIEHS